MTAPATTPVRASRTRLALTGLALLLTMTDLVLKAGAARALADGHSVDLGLLQLRLAYNSGVAFSLGATLPSPVVLAVTGLIVASLAVFAWRTAPTAPRHEQIGLVAILAGAVANLADRAVDGVVTDYLHTGWFPTFNLADVFITCGGALLALAHLRPRANTPPLPMAISPKQGGEPCRSPR